VFARPGSPFRDGRAREVPFTPMAVSASDIRARVARGQSIAGLVPPGVADYIARHRLYGHP
jgi:nicotinate-nucleotide adenylyltransferase